MASQKDDFSADVVGRAFVTQFYEILHQSPEQVYRFYQDSSTMSRPDASGALVTVTAMEGIRDLILSLDSKNYKAEILTADAQASHVNGVIVLVTGCLTGKDNVKKNFTESFFLAPQDTGYFVLNDVFRFVEEASLPAPASEEELFQKSSPEEELFQKDSPAAPVSIVAPVQETVEVVTSSLEDDTAAAEDKVVTPEVSRDVQIPAQADKAVPQSSVGSLQNVQLVVEASSNGHSDVPKKSYASLLMNGKVGHSTTLMQVPAAAKSGKPNPATKAVASHSVLQKATVPVGPKSGPISESSVPNGIPTRNGHVEEKGYSIYIGDLPFNASVELVEKEFKTFGRIKQHGVQVRSNKQYCFGFVEFEDASAKESALQAGTIQIGDKLVRIEDKVTPTRVVNGLTYGRGGSRNDGFRRGNYSNGRGYVRNDYAKGEFSRGSRNGDGHVYQNGGGRGARQGGVSGSK